MFFSLGEDSVISVKNKNKKLSLKCWQIHDTTVGDPFPQPASLPVRNACDIPSPMLSACHTQPLDLCSQPSPTLNLSPLQTGVGRGGPAPDADTMFLNSLCLLPGLESCHCKVLQERKVLTLYIGVLRKL